MIKDLVEELASRTNRERRYFIETYLKSLSVPYKINPEPENQRHLDSENLPRNLIVDFSRENFPVLLLSSHYDKVPGSPGANDNASAVAVLLDALKDTYYSSSFNSLIFAFFDQEEDNLCGSESYVRQKRIGDISAVFNMELVGEGKIPVYWPSGFLSNNYSQLIHKALPPRVIAKDMPFVVGFDGDHSSFRKAGVKDTICLTLACEEDEALFRELIMINGGSVPMDFESKIANSRTMRNYHRETDSAEHIKEESLQLAKEIVTNLIKKYF